MRVLISSIACAPGAGSEGKVGWDSVNAISDQHECHVITHSVYQHAIEQAQSRGEASKTVFHYHGQPYTWHSNRLLARLQSWWIYSAWQRDLLPLAASLHARYRFDLSHHLTYASWRIPSPLWMLPIPFVWGPIGGAGRMPWQFRHILSPSAQLFEAARDLSTLVASRRTDFLSCVRKSAVVVAANSETEQFIRRYRPLLPITKLPNVFFTDKQLNYFRREAFFGPFNKRLSLFVGGNIIGSKGVSIALRALRHAKDEGLQFHFTVAGGGPEVANLKRLTRKLNLSSDVEFHPGLHGNEYRDKLASSDVYLMPSFRETAGITMLEAVLCGCFPVVADTSATGEIARGLGGDAIPITSTADMALRISKSLLWCADNITTMRARAQLARERVVTGFSISSYVQGMNRIYSSAMRRVET